MEICGNIRKRFTSYSEDIQELGCYYFLDILNEF